MWNTNRDTVGQELSKINFIQTDLTYFEIYLFIGLVLEIYLFWNVIFKINLFPCALPETSFSVELRSQLVKSGEHKN